MLLLVYPFMPNSPPRLKKIGSGLAAGLAMYVVGVYATEGVLATGWAIATFGAV